MDALQFFLMHHERVHSQVERELLGGLSDEQLRCRPYERSNSIAWLVWHMARCEDIMGTIIAARPQLLGEAGWLSRFHLSRRDMGTGMTDAEVSGFTAGVDIPTLQDYYQAVGKRTQEVVQRIRPEDLDKIPDPVQVRHVLIGEAAMGENAGWIEQFYEGKTKGWFLGHLGIGHNQMHRGEALTVRGLQGIRNR